MPPPDIEAIAEQVFVALADPSRRADRPACSRIRVAQIAA
jgi:hypothetical protein